MMSDLAHKVVVRMDLSLRVILLNEVIYKIGRMHDLLLRPAIALSCQLIKAIIFLFQAEWLVCVF